MEIWFDIFGYEGLYQVSDKGRVRSLYDAHYDKERIKVLKGGRTPDGYLTVVLYDEHSKQTFYIHRLVAQAFLPDWNPELCVDHINGVRDDCRAENLRMCTQKENSCFELAIEHKKLAKRNSTGPTRSKPVICIVTQQIFESQKECAKFFGVSPGQIYQCCNKGNSIKKNGYHFRYLTSEEISQLF